MKIVVDSSQRTWKMRAHTATHLLHTQIDTLLKWTKQAWSLVDTDSLRFDFTTSRVIEDHEIQLIQSTINEHISWWYNVSVTESTLDEARQLWAKAFFEDKYGERVRVVSIEWVWVHSVELCWWTHVDNTSHIWAFLIVGQESVSSGVRRITAVTWPKVAAYAQQTIIQKNDLAKLVWVQPSQLQDKIGKILQQLHQQDSTIEKLNTQIALGYLDTQFPSSQSIDRIINTLWTPLESVPRKELVHILKSQNIESSRLLYNSQWNYVLSHPKAKQIAKELWLKWWGAPNFVQWRDENIVTAI